MADLPSPVSFLFTTLLLLLLLLLPQSTDAILPTAAIDIYLPETAVSNAITLYASQASFGGQVAKYQQRHNSFLEAGSSGNSRINGVGVTPALPPIDDEYLCNEHEGWSDYSTSTKQQQKYTNTVMLVPRGQCSFESKALSAQHLGASAIIIYGTLSSRYSLNYTNTTLECNNEECNDAKTRTDYTTKDVLWPVNKYDYDCDYSKALIPEGEFKSLDFVKMPGGYNEQNDDLLMGKSENNLCVKYDVTQDVTKSFVNSCASQRCLVTGNNETKDDGSVKYEACCAWDMHVWLFSDTTLPNRTKDEVNEVTIPVVYITMEESTELLDLVKGVSSNKGSDPIVISIYQRYKPEYNPSAVIIWAFGVFVAWIASYHSSIDIRKVSKAVVMQRKLKARQEHDNNGGDGENGTRRVQQRSGGNGSGARSRSNTPPSSPARGTMTMDPVGNETSNPGGEGGEERTIYREDPSDDAAIIRASTPAISPHQEESLELTAGHAIGFIVMASTSLLVLFFFKIYNVVKIMYAFGCSGAFAQIIVHPGLTALCRKLKWHGPLTNMSFLSEENATREALRGGIKGHCLACLWSFFGPIAPLDIAALIISYGTGATWLWVAFTIPHPDTLVFYWVIQDIFGLCMCMLFLETIKLNAIKVGAILLIVAFFYDIFFVFVTPLLTKHGESIMVNVATSGGPPKADPSWCEKYPSDANCKGGDPLPMLFAIPRLGDYQGGCSMLGLGDIVLPGLLLSFASRYDESKRLMGLISGGSGRVANNACPDASGWSNPFCFLCCCCGSGYFGPVVFAYAVGLAMANAAVYLMQMGQPALLYLVPCCLGTMVYIGHRAGELKDLWEGPRVIRSVDALMYGTDSGVDNGEDNQDQEEEDLALEESMNNEEAELT